MTKKVLVNRLRLREDMTWDQATRVVNGVFDDIADEVTSGGDVYIPKFGRFFATTVAEKRCKHPKTKKDVILPAHRIIRFRMAEGLRRKMEK